MNYISDKSPIPRIYKDLLQLRNKAIFKIGNKYTLNVYFSEDLQMVS